MANAVTDTIIDLAECKIHISESGSGPSVVFEAGLGEDLTTWREVQPEVATFAHTFAYDRPGLGKSDPSSHTRTLEVMASELHSLLQKGKVQPPFVLVGHSLGGAVVQVFAHLYPAQVAGLVLVDPEDGRLDVLLHSHMTASDWATRQAAIDAAMPTMPAAVQAELQEYKRSARYSGKLFAVSEIPVVVLTGTKKNPEFPGNPLEQDLKLQLHQALVAKIPNCKHVLVPNSRHYIQNDAPAVVIDAIRNVVSRRSSNK